MSIESEPTPLPSTVTATPGVTTTHPANSLQTVAPVAQSQTVTIPLDQLNAFTAMQARLAKVEEEQQKRDATAREEQVKILAAKGQVEEALRAQREEAQRALDAERIQRTQVEERAKCYALDGELARALSSYSLVAGGAEQLTQLLRDQFIVEPQGSSFAVRTQEFKSAGEHIGSMLGRPEFAHFLRAQNPAGGTGATGTQSTQSTPANSVGDSQPRNFSEAVIMQMAATQKQFADPRLNPTIPFGLRGMPLAKQI
jgi:hypothetical protein